MKLILMISPLLSFVYSHQEIVCPSNTDGMLYDVWCRRNKTEENINCNDNSLKITWGYGDKDNGEIHFTILGYLCKTMEYEMKLFRFMDSSVGIYNDTVKEVSLSKDKNVSSNLIKWHSDRMIKEEEWNFNETKLPTCDEIKNVTFNYVYKGCYIITVNEYLNSSTYYSDPVCFITNFKKESMFKQGVILFSNYVTDLNKLTHVVSNFKRLQVNDFYLEVWQRPDKIEHCNDAKELVSENHVILKSSGIVCNSKSISMPCRLEGDDRIECTTRNVTDGYYCFLVKLNHDPCKLKNSDWNEGEMKCRFSSMIESGFVVENKSVEVSIPSSDSRVTIIMVLTILLFGAFIIALTFFFYKKLSRQVKRTDKCEKTNSSDVVRVDINILLDHPQIYLLYPRDCQPFMDVMKVFRSVLKDVLKSEVYDCFDPDCFEVMAKIGVNWPGKLIANDNVKVVLVETKCASLHLEAHLENFKIAYQDPTAWDDFFMYGLKAVLHNPKYNSYHKLFITRVHGFTSEEDKLKDVTPYTRYDIPGDYYRLLSSISEVFNLTIPDDGKLDIQDLQKAITILEDYRKNNENYLDKLIMKRELIS